MADRGFRVLNDQIARLRIVAKLPEEALPKVASAIGKQIDKQIHAGTDPYGKPWAPRKADGSKPLQDVGKHIRVGIVGRTMIVRLMTRHAVLHHFGNARGRVKRQIIPSKTLPDTWAVIIEREVEKQFAKTMGLG